MHGARDAVLTKNGRGLCLLVSPGLVKWLDSDQPTTQYAVTSVASVWLEEQTKRDMAELDPSGHPEK